MWLDSHSLDALRIRNDEKCLKLFALLLVRTKPALALWEADALVRAPRNRSHGSI
jgi:hypothetical protein